MDHEKDYLASFDEYIRQGEPSKRESAANWQTAIGLQAVDGLRPSAYLLEVANRNIEGEITLEESRKLIDSYYQNKSARTPKEEEEEEADKVAANITRILQSPTFAFNTNGYISLHRRIFDGVFKHAGRLRDYDITKHEWVLDGATVNYLNWEDLRLALDYDIEREKSFSYKGLDRDAIVEHIARFVSGIWQIHAFCEGNTRTTAVFTIQYLRSMGFDVDNQMFALHSWYFRNALVRANYRNVQKDIDYTPVFLERFFRNLLYGEQWELKSRYLHIDSPEEWHQQPNHVTDMSDSIQNDDQINVPNNGTVNGTIKLSQLTDRQRKIYEVIKVGTINGTINVPHDQINDRINDGIKAPAIVEILGISLRTTKRELYVLRDMNLIQYVGSRKDGHWEVVDKEKTNDTQS